MLYPLNLKFLAIQTMPILRPGYFDMLTHCPKNAFYRCRYCHRRGEDCLSSCVDCMRLNSPERISQRVHGRGPAKTKWGNLEMLYIARVLCKKCTLWHLQFSMGRHLFETRIFQDPSRFPDQKSQKAKGEKVFREIDKTWPSTPPIISYGFHTFYEAESTCTACCIKRPGGECDRCIQWNKENVSQRLFLINAHLHIVDAYCDWHDIRLFPISI